MDRHISHIHARRYLFNVSWYRPIPYDPARPWQEPGDKMWYQLLSMDGCNTTTKAVPCEAGGQVRGRERGEMDPGDQSCSQLF